MTSPNKVYDPMSAPLVVIGASAGGPAALTRILCDLAAPFPASIIIIQHVGAQFAEDMAQWLGHQSAIPVEIAKEGDWPSPGTALLAGRDDHLVFKSSFRVGYTAEPSETNYCPSVDVFFDSVVKYWRGDVIGVLLTGMGADGAEGLRRLRVRGATTIAQDQSSSVVYGMPKAAAELKAATEILPLSSIGHRLTTLVRRQIDGPSGRNV